MQAMKDAPEVVGVNRSAERRAQVEKELGIATFATLAAARARQKGVKLFISSTPVYLREMRYIAAVDREGVRPDRVGAGDEREAHVA